MEEEWKKEKRNKQTKKQKENSTKLQEPNVDAEVYNNTKKCDWIYTYTYIPISKVKRAQQQ